MFELLVIILIVVWVVRKRKNNMQEAAGGGGKTPDATVTAAGSRDRRYDMGTNGQRTRTGQGASRSHKETPQAAIQEAKEDGNSTTAYLMEKAEADAREHAREKYEEQKRLHTASGGLAVAERLFEGDPVPQGKKCVVCGYCAAENLVPMIPRTQYSCYFCREPL
ncbi:MAG: hypothetical protein LUI12_12820 [Clostridiales bacterium]|nr:hypothetical protein [Clostridiales bacterium]